METEKKEDAVESSKPGIIKRFYAWVLSWAESRFGPHALVLVSFMESSFFPIPPDVLLIPMSLAKPKKAYQLALFCTIASALGGALGYYLGAEFFTLICEPVIELYHMQEKQKLVEGLYQRYDVAIVFVAGFTPIPYKLFTILGGFCKINFLYFMVASFISRGARFYIVAYVSKGFAGRSVAEVKQHVARIVWIGTAIAIPIALIWYFFIK